MPPPKAIPPARDQLQSCLLVWIVTLLLAPHLITVLIDDWISADVYLQFHAYQYSITSYERYNLEALAVSLAFAVLAWVVKAATPAAAVCGGIICLQLAAPYIGYSWPPMLRRTPLVPLLLLFLLTAAATRYGRARKELRGLSEPRAGRRASQVVANLGIAAIIPELSHAHLFGHASLAFAATIAALAEATADTVSSEIGQAVAGPAILITTFRGVPPGTDGAVSLAGTLGGLLAAAAVVYVALPGQFFRFFAFTVIFAAATIGLFFDSLLGATLERRGWIGNDLVNFASTAFAAAILYPVAHIFSSLTRM
jgi:uncharacterized protein (TIGR00297 family)